VRGFVGIMCLGLSVMRRILRGLFCLCIATLLWLGFVLALGPMSFCDWLSGWINRKFDELFKDF